MTLYDDLGVAPDATPEQIKAAGRKRQKETHPDKGGDPEAFQRVQTAMTVLMDPQKREHYDRTGQAETGSQEALEKAESHAALAHFVDQVMAMGDARYVDLPAHVLRLLDEKIAEFERQTASAKASAEQQISRSAAYLKRLRKKKGDGMIIQILQAKIDQTKRDAAGYEAQMAQKIRILKLARAMAEGHEYECEAHPAYNPGGIGAGLGGRQGSVSLQDLADQMFRGGPGFGGLFR